jgi:biopolymer transport protein ExbD
MNVRPSKKPLLTLESVAMTDIVMNLFIFFFISFSLLYTFNPDKKEESKIEVKLPEGSASESLKKEETPLIVQVTSGNEIYIGSERIAPKNVKNELSSRAKELQAAGIVVRADKRSSVETLVKVLDAAKQSGIRKLGVAMDAAKA